MTAKRGQRWAPCEWGWNLDLGKGWAAQVYKDSPVYWRVFYRCRLLAEGATPSTRAARGRARIVILALSRVTP
jgi:hypothetical protein